MNTSIQDMPRGLDLLHDPMLNKGTAFAAWLAAQAVVFYIVAVAVTRSPLPWQG